LALQTGVPGEGVNSSCNLGNAAGATAAPRSRTLTLQHRQPKFPSSVSRLGKALRSGLTEMAFQHLDRRSSTLAAAKQRRSKNDYAHRCAMKRTIEQITGEQ